MRKTIGTNPLDAVVPNLPMRSQTSDSTSINNGKQTNGKSETETKVAPETKRPAKERLTVHISVSLIERAKNAVFWTPGLTLADLGERAFETLVTELEKKNGSTFETRPHELKGGRPLK